MTTPRLLLGAREEHGVINAEMLRARFLEWTRRNRLERPIVPADDVLRAYVSAGRWVADCPFCGAGVALERDWTEGLCFGCGRLYTELDWPGEADEIERVLRARPYPGNRTWLRAGNRALDALPEGDRRRLRGETLDDLRAENAARGVAARFETKAERDERRQTKGRV